MTWIRIKNVATIKSNKFQAIQKTTRLVNSQAIYQNLQRRHQLQRRLQRWLQKNHTNQSRKNLRKAKSQKRVKNQGIKARKIRVNQVKREREANEAEARVGLGAEIEQGVGVEVGRQRLELDLDRGADQAIIIDLHPKRGQFTRRCMIEQLLRFVGINTLVQDHPIRNISLIDIVITLGEVRIAAIIELIITMMNSIKNRDVSIRVDERHRTTVAHDLEPPDLDRLNRKALKM
jgi:hypothetical protein